MEEELNIANILKDKPSGTKLYADAFGELSLEHINTNRDNSIYVKTKTFNCCSFYNDGKYTKDGEPILVPSKEMRNWNKFAWNTGDILVSDDGKSHIIFSKWYNYNYTSFYGKHYLNKENKDKAIYYETFTDITEKFSLEDKDAAKIYINAIEERLGGKLNLKTLEIEKTQLMFKDGDILSNSIIPNKPNGVFIFKNYNENKNLNCYIGIDELGVLYNGTDLAWCSKDANVRYAIEEEKQRLFKALANVGKHWNAEKKVIEDIKTEYKFKPFEKVLVRNNHNEHWRAAFFGYINENKRYETTSISWKYCIPYKGNESLLGTTKNLEE